jgi:hypothetical protein
MGVGNWWVGRLIKELNKRLIPLAMNSLLVAVNNVHAALHHIQTLIYVAAHSKDTPKHLQEAGVGAGRGGTTAVGSASRSHIWRRSVTSSWSL